MMELLPVLVLAIVQGITEFLPISSSGHLVIVESLHERFSASSLPDLLLLNVVLHGGTLLSILVVFWNRIWRLLGEDRRLLGLLFVATLPAGVLGVWLHYALPHALENPLLAGTMLLVTGAMLLSSTHCAVGEIQYERMTYGQALVIGLFQAFALLPGISRSGSTIVAGLWLGLRREDAATFSFLLVIPAITGACLLHLVELFRKGGVQADWFALLLGMIVSCLVGIAALLWLLQWLQRGKLHYFAFWCIPLGCVIIAWQLWCA